VRYKSLLILCSLFLISCDQVTESNASENKNAEVLIEERLDTKSLNENLQICTGISCSYSPPKLDGNRMALVTSDIMNKAKRVDFHGKESAFKPVTDDFIEGKKFDFLSPFLISEKRSDESLQALLSQECLIKLTQKTYLSMPNGEDSGPFYLYKLTLPNNDKERLAMFVYGLPSNPFKDAVTGYFYIFNDPKECTYFQRVPIFGWDFRKRNEPRFKESYKYEEEVVFSGLARYEDDLFLYFFNGSKPIDSDFGYAFTFSWFEGLQEIKEAPEFSTVKAVSFFDFSENYNPFNYLDEVR